MSQPVFGTAEDGSATLNVSALAEIARETQERNKATSQREVEAFKARAQDRWFVYVDEQNLTVTTWMGDVLGTITHYGLVYSFRVPKTWRTSKRRYICVNGIDGREWRGWYYTSSGQYARIKTKQ